MRFLSLICLFFLISCLSGPNLSDTPKIDFVSLSKNTLHQGDLTSRDSVYLTFSFEDGDGDIGYAANDNVTNVEIIDTRSGVVHANAKTPALPLQGASRGVRGEIEILVYTLCCIFPDGIPPCEPNPPSQYSTDTVSFDIILTDRAGNVSNTIRTSDIYLICD